ncbi:MAG: hypothetical protein QOI91_208, partial [Solirubrobacteraceae bacterium]|nr:hypothetical protein [Solirubrobacteraceae bacterium]
MRRILIVAVASSLATGAAIAATGIAQSGSSPSGPPPTMAQALKDRQSQRDQHTAAIAGRLKVSASDLQAAIDKARRAQLDQAVTDGKLTAAQRDAIVACKDAPLTCDRSNLPAFGPRGGHRGLRKGSTRAATRPPSRAAMQREMRAMDTQMTARRNAFYAAVAKELNKTAAEVKAAFEAERPAGGPERHGPGGPHGPG